MSDPTVMGPRAAEPAATDAPGASEPTWAQLGLRVFSGATGRVVGRLRSITAREVVLATDARIPEGRTLMLSMVLPRSFDGANTVSVMGRCIRSYGHEPTWVAEFEYLNADPATLARLEALSHFLIRNAASMFATRTGHAGRAGAVSGG